jgi:hypothetical protein
LWRELGHRLGLEAFQELGKRFSPKQTKGALKGPQVINFTDLYNDKLKFSIRGRLRAVGPNSAYESIYSDQDGNPVGTWRYEYQVDEKGKESWMETFIPFFSGTGKN